MGGEGSAGLGIIPKKHFFSASLIDLVTVVREYYSCTNNTLLILHWCTLAYMWNCVRAPVNLLQSCSDRQCEKYTCGYAGCVEASRELVSYSSSFNHWPVFRGGGSPRWLHLLQIVFLVIAAYPVFCNPVDHFAETFRSLWFLLPQSNESRHLVFAMLFLIATIVKRRWSTFTSYGRSARCRGARTAHGSSSRNLLFTPKSSPLKSGGGSWKKSTSRHNSQIRISGLWPQRIHITSQAMWELWCATQRINGFHKARGIWQH